MANNAINLTPETLALMSQLFGGAGQPGAGQQPVMGAASSAQAGDKPAKKRSELIIRFGQNKVMHRKDGTTYESFVSLPFDIFLDTMGEPENFGNGPLAQKSRKWKNSLVQRGMALQPGEYETLLSSDTGKTELRLYRIDLTPVENEAVDDEDDFGL